LTVQCSALVPCSAPSPNPEVTVTAVKKSKRGRCFVSSGAGAKCQLHPSKIQCPSIKKKQTEPGSHTKVTHSERLESETPGIDGERGSQGGDGVGHRRQWLHRLDARPLPPRPQLQRPRRRPQPRSVAQPLTMSWSLASDAAAIISNRAVVCR
jgi:hypothetical protein